MNQERFNELVNLFLDQVIDEDDVRELRAAIEADAALKEAFIRRYQLHRALTASLAATSVPSSNPALGLLTFAAAGSAVFAFALVSLLVGLSLAFESYQAKNAIDSAGNPAFAAFQPTHNVNVRQIHIARSRLEREGTVALGTEPNSAKTAVSNGHLLTVTNDTSLELRFGNVESVESQWPDFTKRPQSNEHGFIHTNYEIRRSVLP